jgi:cytochrome c oxidase subunit IV
MSSETTDTQREISHAVDDAVEPAHGVDEHAAGDHKHGLTDVGYVKVAAVLALMTGLEVTLTYVNLPGGVFMTALLTLMVLKFWTVVSYFMHLKFDNSLFTKLFYTGLFLALFVFGVVMLTFQFFAPS